MPRAKVAKKQTASELPATNGNDASSLSETSVNNEVTDDIKQAPKSKARGKKAAAATAAGEANGEQGTEIVVKKTAVRGKKKETEKFEIDVEVSEIPKPKGRARKPTTEVKDEEQPKAKVPKPRAKKEKTPATEGPEVVIKGRVKKDKPSPNEEDIVAPIKSRGRKKKEPELKDTTEAVEPPPPTKGRAKKNVNETATKNDDKQLETEPVVPPPPAKAAATTKRARANKRLADTEITEVLEAEEDPVPEPEAEQVGKKRSKPVKKTNDTVELPAKKRGRKAESVEPPQIPVVKVASTSRKRAPKRGNENPDENLNAPEPLPETKPGRGRKRQAPVINEENGDAITADAADGSKTSKTKKTKDQKVEVETAGSYDKSLFTSPEDKTYNLKISSWNVAGLRAWLKKDGLKFVEVEEPDIFCLQETKCSNDQLPDEMTRLPGYHPYWLCMPGGYAGVAIYSKIMPINVEYGIGNEEFDDVGRMITAEYEKYFLINVYVPNSGRKLVNLEMRMRWEKLFQAYVQKLDALKAVVICGDMNVSHLEIDLANPKANTRNAGFTKEERDKMTELLSLGYVDTFRHLYPKRTGAYTFWTYMANARSRNVGWRLDYCIVSERFVPRIVDNVMRSQCLGSDHCPITVFLNV